MELADAISCIEQDGWVRLPGIYSKEQISQALERVKDWDERTRDQMGLIIPVVITIFQDRSYSFITKTPPASILLKKAAGLAKGSGEPNKNKVGKVTDKQIEEIAKQKLPDLNSNDIKGAKQIIAGTARSMGIEIES